MERGERERREGRKGGESGEEGKAHLDVFPKELTAIVQPAEIQKVPQQLNRRLRAIHEFLSRKNRIKERRAREK